jgi:hypothetical protein
MNTSSPEVGTEGFQTPAYQLPEPVEVTVAAHALVVVKTNAASMQTSKDKKDARPASEMRRFIWELPRLVHSLLRRGV